MVHLVTYWAYHLRWDSLKINKLAIHGQPAVLRLIF